MSRLNGAGLIAPISSFPARHDGGGHHSRISRLYGSSLSAASSCHGFWHNAALVIPSALFIAYLGFQAKRNIKKLRHSRSYVMIAYYVLLWFSALFGLAWSSLQVLFFFLFVLSFLLFVFWIFVNIKLRGCNERLTSKAFVLLLLHF